MTPKSATTPRTDAARLHDYPRLLEFFHKHAVGPLGKSSCLVCGRDDYSEVAIQHMELPGIVVCLKCRDAAKGRPTPKSATTPTREEVEDQVQAFASAVGAMEMATDSSYQDDCDQAEAALKASIDALYAELAAMTARVEDAEQELAAKDRVIAGAVQVNDALQARVAELERDMDARCDRSYYDGAKQAAIIANQSLDELDEWVQGGCGGRLQQSRDAIRDATIDKAQEQKP